MQVRTAKWKRCIGQGLRGRGPELPHLLWACLPPSTQKPSVQGLVIGFSLGRYD